MKPNSEHNAIKISEVIETKNGVITSISIQKKNSTRYSVYVNEKFLIGVSDNSLVKFALSKGKSINQELLDAIQVNEEKWAIHSFCLRLLGRRDHASFELVRKCRSKGYKENWIQEVIAQLSDKGYINNAAFAQKFAHDKFEFNNWGPYKIRAELLKKGLKEPDVRNALSDLTNENLSLRLDKLYNKHKLKFFRYKKENRRKKIFDFFLRKGYDADIILKALPNWMADLEQ